MSDDRRARVKAILEAALDRHGEDRSAFLDETCEGNFQFRAEVESLIEAATIQVGTPDRVPAKAVERRGLSIPRRCPDCGTRYDSRRRVCAVDGSVLDDDLEALVGTTFDDRFRIEAVLGRGGMGVVLRARHGDLDDVVAIKLLDDRLASDARALRRFVREGQIVRRFHHPAVVGIHDLVCGDSGPVYLVLEYVEGRTLGSLLREKGQFSPRAAVDIVRPIADALDAAHSHGIVHRDLKPENIMVRDEDAVPRSKLLDLGIAIVHATDEHGADTRLTRQGQWIGTPLYMAPEQWNSSDPGAAIDGRADVYALGVVVHQLVSGATPFCGDIGALRTLHLGGQPRRLDASVAGVPRAFASAVATAMAKDRRERFASAGEFVAQLERSLATGFQDDAVDDAVEATLTGMGGVFSDSPESCARTSEGDAAQTGESDRPPGNLPAQVTSFIAPAGAVDSIASAFERSRCVTLTGPGGIGKTRLSLEATTRLEGVFPDGTWFVELASIADPAHVVRAVADALGARERPGEPLSASIHDRIGDARLVIVLDNCEHVVDAAATVARDLLRACLRASVLATSREALAIPGELVVVVAPLSVPSDDAATAELGRSPAVQLFLDRAKSAAPAFAPSDGDLGVVAAICRRLDGLPLAIELAAARVRAFGLQEVLARLDDRFRLLAASDRARDPRQRTLHAAIDWSYRLLSEGERALLQRLAAFASGAVLGAIERVASDDGVAPVVEWGDVADLVESLVAKSFVSADLERNPVRYRMFESIREFALDELETSGDRAAVEARIDDLVADLARAFRAADATAEEQLEEARISAELDTVRQSLARMARRDDGGALLAETAGALGAFFESRGLFSEGAAWLDAAVAAGNAQPERGLALYWSGKLSINRGDYDAADRRLSEALALGRAKDDRPAIARSLRSMAHLAMRRNEEDRAIELAAEAERYYRELGDEEGEASSIRLSATVAMNRHDYSTALPLFERADAIHRRGGHQRSLAINCYAMALVLSGLGEHDAAERRAKEAVAIAERLDDPQTLAYAMSFSGRVAYRRGDAAQSAHFLGRTLAMARSIGDDAACVYAVEGIAEAIALAGRPDVAVALSAAAERHRQATDRAMATLELESHTQRLEPARAALSPEELGAAEARGRSLSFEDAMARALDAASDTGS